MVDMVQSAPAGTSQAGKGPSRTTLKRAALGLAALAGIAAASDYGHRY